MRITREELEDMEIDEIYDILDGFDTVEGYQQCEGYLSITVEDEDGFIHVPFDFSKSPGEQSKEDLDRMVSVLNSLR